MSNGSGSYRSTRENSMRAFDKLPASVRAALANANYNWATQPFLTSFEKRGRWKTGKEMAQYITTIDTAEVGKEARRLYGPDHPQASHLPRVKKGRRT